MQKSATKPLPYTSSALNPPRCTLPSATVLLLLFAAHTHTFWGANADSLDADEKVTLGATKTLVTTSAEAARPYINTLDDPSINVIENISTQLGHEGGDNSCQMGKLTAYQTVADRKSCV